MVAAFVMLLAFQTGEGAEGADTPPNIVVFLSDDMGWGQPGFNGGTEVPTPNIDRIAEEGVKLTQFYVQPVCSPTRAALLTGRYAWKNGAEIRTSVRAANGMLLDERTIAEVLGDAGYAPWMVGKWHLGQWRDEHLPLQRGFDHHYGFYSARVDSFTLRRHVILDWHRNGRPVVESGYATFLLADDAVQLIARHDGRRPFFLYVAFGAVHLPHVAPAEYVEKYSHLPNPSQLGMLDAMDVAMGRVIAALEAKDALDDTLLVFLNDNGANEANKPYRGSKGTYYEGGILSPTALRWPGRIPAGSESDALLHVVDLFPTLAGLAGAEPDASLPLDGLDAWEAIAKGAESPRTEVVHSLDVIREGDWKLLEEDATYYNWSADTLQLYNIREDPYEQTNLAATETAKVAELRERLAYHRPFEREAEAYEEIPEFPPVVYGKKEQEAFGTYLKKALRQLDAGNPGPVLVRAEAFADGVRLVYDRTMDADSVPPASAFKLVENPGYSSVEVTEVNVTGSAILLTPGQSLRAGDTVGVTYEVPATGAIRDTDGIEAVGVTWVTTPPDQHPADLERCHAKRPDALRDRCRDVRVLDDHLRGDGAAGGVEHDGDGDTERCGCLADDRGRRRQHGRRRQRGVPVQRREHDHDHGDGSRRRDHRHLHGDCDAPGAGPRRSAAAVASGLRRPVRQRAVRPVVGRCHPVVGHVVVGRAVGVRP